MLWPCGSLQYARVYDCGGERPKDLGTLDGSRGGLILPRRAKVSALHKPRSYRAQLIDAWIRDSVQPFDPQISLAGLLPHPTPTAGMCISKRLYVL
jgi:hypothetical protein